MPAADIAKNIDKFPPKDKKPPIVIYDENGGDDARNAARSLIKAGYTAVIMAGGFDAWTGGRLPCRDRQPRVRTSCTFPNRGPGEISMDDFKRIASATPADTLILDVRNKEEAEAGMIKGAKCIPDEELLDRLADIPKEKKIVTHCSTGVRAEMAYHKLKEKGYNVQFVNAKVDIDSAGSFKLEKP